MLVMVTFIATLVAIYSVGYMHGDPGYPRFFADVGLFVFSMTVLVLANNFLAAVCLLGRRRPVQLSADRLLVHEAVGRRGGPQGVPGHPHRRRRLAARHLAAVVELSATTSSYDDVFEPVASRPTARPARCHGRVPAAVLRRGRQVGAVPAARLVARRDGRPDARQRPDPRRDDGHGRRLPRRPLHAALLPAPDAPAGRRLHRRLHGAAGGPDRPDAERPQARAGLFDRQPARLHVPALGCGSRRARSHCRRHGGDVPPVHARLLQGPAVPRGRQRDARDGRRHRHAPVRRPAQGAADDALDVPVRRRWPWPASAACPASGARTRSSPAAYAKQGHQNSWSTMSCSVVGLVHCGPDGVLHLPGLLHDVLGRGAHSRTRPAITPTNRRRS